MAVSSIAEVVEDIKAGKMIILVDDEDRENEGDLCMAAELVTPEAINFMATHRPRPDLSGHEPGHHRSVRAADDGAEQSVALRYRFHRQH